MSPRNRPLAALALALAGLAGAWACAASVDRASLLWHEPDWPAIAAEVLDIAPAGLESDGYRLRIRYRPQDHGEIETVTRDTIDGAQAGLLREAAARTPAGRATALVYYRPDQPSDVRITRQVRGARISAAGFGALGLVAAALSILGFRLAAGLLLSPAGSRSSGNIAPDSTSPR